MLMLMSCADDIFACRYAELFTPLFAAMIFDAIRLMMPYALFIFDAIYADYFFFISMRHLFFDAAYIMSALPRTLYALLRRDDRRVLMPLAPSLFYYAMRRSQRRLARRRRAVGF